MGDGTGEGDDKLKLEEGEVNFSARVVLAMITRLKAIKEAGSVTQDDMLSLLENWIKLTIHFQRGGEADRLKYGTVKDSRTQALAVAYSRKGLLADFKADPKAPMTVSRREDIDHPPKPSAAFADALEQLMDVVYDDHEDARKRAYYAAEGAFGVLYYNYRTLLAADPDAEHHFRALVARLRNGHVLH